MSTNRFDNIMLGVTFGFKAKAGYFASDEAKKEAKAIADAGIKWVTVVPTVYQETWSSAVQFMDFDFTPTDIEVIEIIEYFHSLGVHVQLRPMLETLDGGGRMEVWLCDDVDWRMPGGKIDTCSRWFRSMTARSVHYAMIAEHTGCELYCLDSELDRIIRFNDQWKNVIAAVRKVYSGPVTSCHTSHCDAVDFEKALSDKNHWFYDLDMLSISCYHPAAEKPYSTVDEMKSAYQSQVLRFRKYALMYEKSILFGECGCSSSVGGAMNPPMRGEKYDGEEQAHYLEAVVESFKNEKWWRGLCWWKWDEQVEGRRTDTGFTVKGKPAASLFEKYTNELNKISN